MSLCSLIRTGKTKQSSEKLGESERWWACVHLEGNTVWSDMTRLTPYSSEMGFDEELYSL